MCKIVSNLTFTALTTPGSVHTEHILQIPWLIIDSDSDRMLFWRPLWQPQLKSSLTDPVTFQLWTCKNFFLESRNGFFTGITHGRWLYFGFRIRYIYIVQCKCTFVFVLNYQFVSFQISWLLLQTSEFQIHYTQFSQVHTSMKHYRRKRFLVSKWKMFWRGTVF